MASKTAKKQASKKESVDEFIRSALGSTKREPGWEYGNVLPVRVRKNKQGKKEREWGLGYSDTAKSMLDAITLPRRAMEGEEVTPEQAMEMAMNVTAPGVASARYVPGMANMPIVYHGTPHRFEPTPDNPLGEFRASQIGTGEGAHAYGHGIYLAETPDVAKGYQKTIRQLSPYTIDGESYHGTTTRMDARVGDYAANALERFDGDKKAAIDWLKNGSPDEQEAAKMLRKAKSISRNEGSLYTSDLPDEMVDRMLDWDKPLSEQAHLFGETGNPASILTPEQIDAVRVFGGLEKHSTGGEFYKALTEGAMSPRAASEALNAAGIPGIKYLDAGSRGDKAKPTRNFVLFPGEEKKAKILKRE